MTIKILRYITIKHWKPIKMHLNLVHYRINYVIVCWYGRKHIYPHNILYFYIYLIYTYFFRVSLFATCLVAKLDYFLQELKSLRWSSHIIKGEPADSWAQVGRHVRNHLHIIFIPLKHRLLLQISHLKRNTNTSAHPQSARNAWLNQFPLHLPCKQEWRRRFPQRGKTGIPWSEGLRNEIWTVCSFVMGLHNSIRISQRACSWKQKQNQHKGGSVVSAGSLKNKFSMINRMSL